jgi:hypothetical protein
VTDEEKIDAAKLPCSAAGVFCPDTAVPVCCMGADQLKRLQHQEGISPKALRDATITLNFPWGVARVSRLIGKFDSTAKRSGWQVDFGGMLFGKGSPRPASAQKLETPLRRSGVSLSCAGHWPPKMGEDGGYVHRACCRFFDRLSLLRAAHWRFLLSNPAVLVPAGIASRKRYITGAEYIAIAGPFDASFVFNRLWCAIAGRLLSSGI